MSHSFSQLVWLGADTASEPNDLLNKAKHATLFEARESACKALKQKFAQKNITVIQSVLSTTNKPITFTEYTLAEFSAIQPATGLKELFPGIRAIHQEQLPSIAIGDAINSLNLSDNNNLLVMDIADSNLLLLKAIEENKQLSLFNSIYVQATIEPLYDGAATAAEITNFLQAQGYLLQQTCSDDPDLPWLSFGLNPLWNKLRQAQQELATVKLSIEQTESEQTLQLATVSKAKQDAEQQLVAIKQQLIAAHQELEILTLAADQVRSKHEQELKIAVKAKQDAEQKLSLIKAENEKILTVQKEKTHKFSSDAQIDEFISDLSDFFTGKFITYVDVGAYTGEILEKIVASKKIKVREAHLYEPNPESFKALKERFSETKINSFHINNFAIGNSEKKVSLLPAHSMTKIISQEDISENRHDVFVSDVKILDSEINKVTERHIHLLKIDVEGYEIEVLQGSAQLLRNQLVDVIYIEVGFNKKGTQQTYMADIDSYLQDHNYRVFKIYEQKNEWIEDSPLLRRCNFAYMSETFAKANPFKLTATIAELQRELTKLKTAGIKNPV